HAIEAVERVFEDTIGGIKFGGSLLRFCFISKLLQQISRIIEERLFLQRLLALPTGCRAQLLRGFIDGFAGLLFALFVSLQLFLLLALLFEAPIALLVGRL